MNNDIRDLLTKTLGVIHSTTQGIHSTKIDPKEYVNLLHMKSVNTNIATGNWVQIKRGIYKGDIGQITATHAWGVDLYLVPRIPTEKNGNTLKRKASTVIPEPMLFCAETSNLGAIHHPDGTYRIGRLIFEHGLIVKTFDYHSIGPQVREIPWKLYTFFSLSKHPNISLSSLPHPQEWIFATGDNIVISPSNKIGVIISIETNFAEVEIPEEGLHSVFWHNITKYFKIGDFVCISSGPDHNTNGWIISINENIATIANKTKGENDYNLSNAINVSYYEIILFILTIFTDD